MSAVGRWSGGVGAGAGSVSVADGRGGVDDARPTVLVVDDSAENRYATRRVLERDGFAVREAETGAEALARAAEDPALIILDVNLPDTSGFEVCQRLKHDPRTQHIPVMHLSHTHVTDASRVHGLESGADAYLTEPVDPGVLTATTRALLRMRQAEDRLRAEVAHAELMTRLGVELADALTREQVIDAIVHRIRRDLGAGEASLHLVEEPDLIRLAHPGLRGTLRSGNAALRRDTLAPAARVPAADVLRSGRAMFGDLEAFAHRYPDLAPSYRAVDDGYWAIVPVVAYGYRLGVLFLTYATSDPLPTTRRELLVELGRGCGQALERAVLYEQQQHIASALQAGLLPGRLPTIAGIDLAASYRPGAATMDVGGDFYDVFATGDSWLAVIGDVCGHGPEAAALTALARHTIRAEARHQGGPGALLATLNDAIVAQRDEDTRFITGACVRFEPGADDVGVTAAVAGHPPLLVGRADGQVDVISPTGPLLGVFDDVEVEELSFRLRPDDVLVLYTDGITEARRDQDQFGDDRLRDLLRRLTLQGAGAATTVSAILDAATAHGGRSDDVAILALRHH